MAMAMAARQRLRGCDFLGGGMGRQPDRSRGKELGQVCRIRFSDNRLQGILRAFLLSERPPKSCELALLGEAVRELREQRGLSQGELAAASGVPERRIKALEAGRVDPDFVLLYSLARVLGVRAGSLVLRAEELAKESGGSADAPT